ncbi:MAG TPA: hypothetical protein VFC68_06080 [Treponemataceae bacterium]|nr:hypothetical protein [Treponemataceae bacterium]
MKNDSKERLEKQLNENPELKERFDMQMNDVRDSMEATRLQLKPIVESLKATIQHPEPLASIIKADFEAFRLHGEKMREPMTRKLGILKTDYDSIVAQYLSYFKKTGFIQPKDFDEFFTWLTRFRYSDEPFGTLEIQDNDFKLFHEYKERKLNNTNWNYVDEWEFISGNKPKLQMDLSKLNGKLNMKYHEYFDRFKSDLKDFVPRYEKKRIAALALIIFESDVLHKNIVDKELKNFKNWYEFFCNVLGVEVSQYKPVTIKDNKTEIEELKNTYHYFDL